MEVVDEIGDSITFLFINFRLLGGSYGDRSRSKCGV